MTAPQVVASVPSASTPGRRYAVRLFPDGLDCPCPAFGFSKAKACAHTRLVEAAQAAAKRCESAEHAVRTRAFAVDTATGQEFETDVSGHPGDWVCLQCVVDLLAAAARKVKATYVPKAKLAAQRAAKRERKKEAKKSDTKRKRR